MVHRQRQPENVQIRHIQPMSRHKTTVLLLGGARRVSVAELLKKSGERIGCDVEIVSYELNDRVPISILGKVEVGLKWSDPAVVADIVRVATEHEASIILPLVDGARRNRRQMPRASSRRIHPCGRLRDILPDVRQGRGCKAFRGAGLPIPQTYSVINAEIPVIAKPRKARRQEAYMSSTIWKTLRIFRILTTTYCRNTSRTSRNTR